jgi:hypothetical protein
MHPVNSGLPERELGTRDGRNAGRAVFWVPFSSHAAARTEVMKPSPRGQKRTLMAKPWVRTKRAKDCRSDAGRPHDQRSR